MKKLIRYIITGWLPVTLLLTQPVFAQEAKPTSGTDTTIVEMQTNRAPVIEPGPLPEIKKEVSITGTHSVSGQVLYKTPVPNITNTLYGYLPGLTVKQGSGEPGYDDATVFIRGRGNFENDKMVIYVDGFQTTPSFFSYISASEIESISVLKDPVTLATFGMKGSNGVLWVVTKRGYAGKRKVQVQLVSGIQEPIRITKPYGAYDYARLYNQAISNDNYALNGYKYQYTPTYTDAQLEAYQHGTGTNIDWYNQVLKKNGFYSDANVVFSGGGNDTKYALILDYMRQRGFSMMWVPTPPPPMPRYNGSISAPTSTSISSKYSKQKLIWAEGLKTGVIRILTGLHYGQLCRGFR